MKVYDVHHTVFTNQTGQFPTHSESGNKYIMVMVNIDSRGILVEPIKNRTDIQLKKQLLDNEISAAMKQTITEKNKMMYELVPPGCHQRNAAKLALQNFKSHIISILAGVIDDFPLKLWDKLLPQAEFTINLLRQSNATPTVSAYAHLNGPFS
ncbi:hypothetical protein ACHAW6_011687 [Cyclotella cf. meneghiniana]